MNEQQNDAVEAAMNKAAYLAKIFPNRSDLLDDGRYLITLAAELTALRAENAELKTDRNVWKAEVEARKQWPNIVHEKNLLTIQLAAEKARADALAKELEEAKSLQYRALTIQLLRLRVELFRGAGMDKDTFTRTYLNGLGVYERQVAVKEGIEINE